ncbi:reverse transcriptase domain-containing protein [Tanacetum coccineum]|uniref:Reverse transcriptase domain-containing protein n=1 Tax=Tanacetum coccineum TaxID=301880 RepID=A0ABQ5GZH4_9ASTR
MHLKRQIEEMLKARKLSHLIKELKQSNGKYQAKVAKKGEAAGKDKPLAILMVQTGRKIAKQRITQTFSSGTMISFPPLGEEDETEGPMVIEAEVGGYLVHHMYVDGGASSEILYEHCDDEHSTSAWMDFMVVRSHSPYNGIIGGPGVRRIKAIPSTTHGMLKFPVTGSTLTEEDRKKLCGLLRQNLDIFAWKPADMTGVPRHIAGHRLNVREGCFPVRQKKKGQASERNKAICEEVEKLVNADFKYLNKECPKDGYSLPEIDWKVEYLCEYPFKCFLDAYKGYHQIKMAKEDEEKTAYQNLHGTRSNPGRGRNIQNPQKDKHEVKSEKCTFEMKEGVFLGYKVNSDGLMVCPDKVAAVLSLPSPKCLKDVQRLNGKLASLNGFLSKSAERSLPFFKTLKTCTKKSDFQWTTEVEMAFQQMKKSIAELPMMTAPQEKEELIIYLAAAKEAISVVLMTERDGKQIPIYFVSQGTTRCLGRTNTLQSRGWSFTEALRFGLPGEIISDNGKQFQDNPFKDWCEKLCIRQHFASVKHSQTNGLVKRANRTVIPAEVSMPTLRTAEVNLEENKEALEINLDLLEERRDQAAIREAKSKAKMERYYNSKVRSVSFKLEDLVYRNNEASRVEDTGKLGPKWEGPYEVTEALGKGAYKLRDRDGNQLPQT